MADVTDTKALAKGKPVTPAANEGEGDRRRGWLSWVVGWVLVPGTVVGLIFGSGMLLGAHRSEGWFARTVMWIAGWF